MPYTKKLLQLPPYEGASLSTTEYLNSLDCNINRCFVANVNDNIDTNLIRTPILYSDCFPTYCSTIDTSWNEASVQAGKALLDSLTSTQVSTQTNSQEGKSDVIYFNCGDTRLTSQEMISLIPGRYLDGSVINSFLIFSWINHARQDVIILSTEFYTYLSDFHRGYSFNNVKNITRLWSSADFM